MPVLNWVYSQDICMIWKMANENLQCYNRGCGQIFNPINNNDGNQLVSIYIWNYKNTVFLTFHPI